MCVCDSKVEFGRPSPWLRACSVSLFDHHTKISQHIIQVYRHAIDLLLELAALLKKNYIIN